MKKHTFVKKSRFPVSQEELFQWHCRDDAFELLTPPWRKVEITERSDGGLRQGYWQIMKISTPLFPQYWRAAITEFRSPELFVDEQESGPFAYWRHRHIMRPVSDNEAELCDEVTYAVPFGWLGELLLGGYIRRDIERLFEFRHERMMEYLSGS